MEEEASAWAGRCGGAARAAALLQRPTVFQKVGKAREEALRGNGVSTRGFVRVKLRGRGRNFSSPKRLGVNIMSCWEGGFPHLSKNKDLEDI